MIRTKIILKNKRRELFDLLKRQNMKAQPRSLFSKKELAKIESMAEHFRQHEIEHNRKKAERPASTSEVQELTNILSKCKALRLNGNST